MAAEAKIGEASRIMFEIAEERGLLGEGWREAWWHGAGLRMAVEAAGWPILRISWGTGDVWAGWHTPKGSATVFAISGPEVLPEVLGLDSTAGLGVLKRAAAAHRWVSWYDGLTEAKWGRRPPLQVGDYVGGVLASGRWLLGQVVELRGGAVAQLQCGAEVRQADAGGKWFAWRGEARGMAAESLAEAGECEFPSYLSMRAKVAARARLLISAGLAENDPDRPLKLQWKRGRKPKAEKSLAGLSELA